MVEHLTADQEVPSSTLGAPYIDVTCSLSVRNVGFNLHIEAGQPFIDQGVSQLREVKFKI